MYNPKRFSFSKMDTYDKCGFKYLLQYKYENFGPGNIATELGGAIHKIEEDIAQFIMRGEPIDYVGLKNRLIKKMVELQINYPKQWETPDKIGRYYKEKVFGYLDDGIYYLEQYMRDHPDYEIIATEQKFEYEYGDGYKFNGSIDRVIRDRSTGRLLVQDIKTYTAPEKPEELATPLQFVVYVMAAAKLFGVLEDDIRCQFYLPFCGGMYQDGGTKGYMDRGRKKIDKLLAGIKDEDWSPKPSALCHWCNFCPTNDSLQDDRLKHLCPFFMHWTRENKTFMKENAFDKDSPAEMKSLVERYHAAHGVTIEKPKADGK